MARVGYPISQRLWHGGFLPQAFQRLVLQWRPELGWAVPVNVLVGNAGDLAREAGLWPLASDE